MKMDLEEFLELNVDELIAVNGGGSGTCSGSSWAGDCDYYSESTRGSGGSSSGSCSGSSSGASTGTSGSCGGSSTVGTCSGSSSGASGTAGTSGGSSIADTNGSNNTLLTAIGKESGATYNNNCDDWAINVLNDANITVGTTALKGDKTCQIRQEELIEQCDNELTSYTQMQAGTWYLGCSSSLMFLVSKNSNNTYTIADSTGCSCWNNSKAGIHGIGDYADSQTYGASNAVYVPLP